MAFTPSLPSQMKAYAFSEHGEPSKVLHQIVAPIPHPSPTQVLLKVRAVALNPIGYKSMMNFPSFVIKKPCIPESDVSGVIVAVGKDVKEWKVGDQVFGVTPGRDYFKTGQGALAEYTVVREEFIYKKPEFLSWEEASSTYIAGLSAYQSLLDDRRTPLSRGQSVFINGGSGGVGLFTIQFARHIVGETGTIVTSCSARNRDLVIQCGANEAIDYTTVDLPIYLSQNYSQSRFDLIIDNVGSLNLYYKSPAYLKDKGEFIVIGMETPKSIWGALSLIWTLGLAMYRPRILGGTPRRFCVTMVKATKDRVQKIGKLLENREAKPILDSVWRFDDEGVQNAYSKIMSHRARGKVVITIQDEST